MLAGYAGYLIAQNGNPRKDLVAIPRSYFAIQTRKQELVEERLHQIGDMTSWRTVPQATGEVGKQRATESC